MKKKVIIFCLILTIIISILTFIYYLNNSIDAPSTIVLGTIVSSNLNIINEIIKLNKSTKNEFKLWRSFFSTYICAIILSIKIIKETSGCIGIVVFFLFILTITLVTLNYFVKNED